MNSILFYTSWEMAVATTQGNKWLEKKENMADIVVYGLHCVIGFASKNVPTVSIV